MNAVEIEEAITKLAEQPFDAAEFPYAFLEAFGNKATTINRLRKGDSNKSDIDGAVFQHNNPRMLLNLRKCRTKIRVFDPACGSGNFLAARALLLHSHILLTARIL